MAIKIILVFLGGAIGTSMRAILGLLMPHAPGAFPMDVFVANIIAAFLLGLATAALRVKRVSENFVLFVGTGIMGGMSTFATYVFGAYEEMMTVGGIWLGVFYVLVSAVLGYGATLLGLRLVRPPVEAS